MQHFVQCPDSALGPLKFKKIFTSLSMISVQRTTTRFFKAQLTHIKVIRIKFLFQTTFQLFIYIYMYIYIYFFFFFFFFMVPASRPDCKLRWNIERERVQKNTGERGLDKLNFCQTTLVIFSCHGIFPLKSLDRLQLLPWGAGGGKFLMKLCNGITGKSSYKIIYFRVLEVI